MPASGVLYRFTCDNTVGRLRRWLCLAGYDAEYDGRPARAILEGWLAAGTWGRTALGRCPSLAEEFRRGVGLARRIGESAAGGLEGVAFVHLASEELGAQIGQVAGAFPLDFGRTMFSRCSHCNAPLGAEKPLSAVRGDVPAQTREWLDAYRECGVCGRVYWMGTHTDGIRCFLEASIGGRG